MYWWQNIKTTKTVWLEYNKFLQYMELETKDRVKFLLENWIKDFNY